MTASILPWLFAAGAPDWISPILRTISVIVGLFLLWTAIMAAVGVMLVPRPSNQKLALWVSRTCHVVFHTIARRAKTYRQLDRLLAVQGATTILLYLALFLSIFVMSFAFLFFGITGCAPLTAVYGAGSGMSTLGIVQFPGATSYIVMVVAAFTGTTVVSVFIGFLLSLYGAYTIRETQMSKMSMICGEPGWGPEMLVRMKVLRLDWSADGIEKGIDWICSTRVSQFIYPLLNHFRSPVSERHWAVTLLALLDAAALQLSVLPGEKNRNLVRVLAQGVDAFHALKLSEISRTQSIESEGIVLTWAIEETLLTPKGEGPIPDPGISRAEWEEALDFLTSHGVEVLSERDTAWEQFCRIRAYYVEPAYFLTSHLAAINAPWSGPRHPALDFPLTYPRMARRVFAPDGHRPTA